MCPVEKTYYSNCSDYLPSKSTGRRKSEAMCKIIRRQKKQELYWSPFRNVTSVHGHRKDHSVHSSGLHVHTVFPSLFHRWMQSYIPPAKCLATCNSCNFCFPVQGQTWNIAHVHPTPGSRPLGSLGISWDVAHGSCMWQLKLQTMEWAVDTQNPQAERALVARWWTTPRRIWCQPESEYSVAIHSASGDTVLLSTTSNV